MRELAGQYLRAVRAFRLQWTIVFIGHIFFFASNTVLIPYLYSRIVDRISGVASGGVSLSSFYPIIGLLILVHIMQTSVGQASLAALRVAMPGSVKYLEDHAFSHLLKKSAGFYANNFTGSLVTKFNRFSRSFQVIAESVTFDLLEMIIKFVFPLIFIIYVAPMVAVVYVGFAGIMAASLYILHKRKIAYSRGVAAQESVKTGILADALTNILSVKTFSSLKGESRLFRSASHEWFLRSKRNAEVGNYIRLYKIVIWTTNEALVMLFVARQAVNGAIGVGDATAILLYVRQLSESVWNFGKIIEKTEQSIADATEMAEILREPLGVEDPEKPEKFKPKYGAVTFDHAHFAYEDAGSSEVFTDLNLIIKPQQKVGLVGPSGGGKSTLVKLLLRFSDIQKGAITIDGQNIAHVAQDDLRRAIAYVPQEPVLFHRTIAENITYGLDKVSKQKLDEVVKLSHVSEFIDDLPNGLDTMVGERGVKLSGGQKQRIAIARAMLKQAPLLILDEATSALDSKSEKLIISALDNLMKGRTTIVIAHRLSTIKKLDRIIVLDRGAIKEDGTHVELVEQSGIYANLWQHQMGNFIE